MLVDFAIVKKEMWPVKSAPIITYVLFSNGWRMKSKGRSAMTLRNTGRVFISLS